MSRPVQITVIGGAWVTLSEIAFARRLGRPVVGIGTWELRSDSEAESIETAADAASAVALALGHARGNRHDV